MPRLSLYLLGPPRIELDGELIKVDSHKALALLTFLIVTQEGHSRDELINLLWPEFDTERGRTNLRHTLYLLRKSLPGDWFETDRSAIRLVACVDVWLDVAQFKQHLDECLGHGHSLSEICSACITPLTAAVSLYRGDFLSGFTLADSVNLDDWILFQSELLRRFYSDALARLVKCYCSQGSYETGAEVARRWLALDRLNEDAHCQLMQIYAWLGQRSSVIRQYQECVQVLNDELGVTPQASTTALYQKLVQGDSVRSGESPAPSEHFMVGSLLQNRYHISAELGRGSLGVVYRAHDSLLDRDVAIKVVPAKKLSLDGRARLIQEARAAARLSHPNIVVVHDVGGVEDIHGYAFIVMELIEGEPLHHCIPDNLDQILGIARQVLGALEHAHTHGVIHRDVKPQNVLLSKDGAVKLNDFGLARTVDSRITHEGAIVGTVAYMAPEQAMGAEIDSRADLYSFGVMLYELTTGQLPFTGEDPLVLLSQHLHAPVIPPRMHNPNLPPALDDLIVSLLSKAPGDRPLSAARVLKILEGLTSVVERLSGRSTHRLEAIDRINSTQDEVGERRTGVFVGREPELARLSARLNLAIKGEAQVLFVTGDAGRGKTSLIQEFARRAQSQWSDLLVASGNTDAYTGPGDPYLPFRSILGLLTGDIDALWTARAISREHARRIWDAFPRVVTSLVEVGQDLINTIVPGQALLRRAIAYASGGISDQASWLAQLTDLVNRLAVNPRDQNEQQSALFEQYAQVMMAIANEYPLLLILDDLQWADTASINMLFHLLRRFGRRRILILGAYRPEDLAIGRHGERHPLEDLIHELQRLFGDILVDLARAEARQFVELYVETESNRLSGLFRETLFRQTAGHPLFTVELLRGMEERGDLVKDDEGYWVEGNILEWNTLPGRVEAVIAQRIDRLDDSLREILEIASVEGETFTAEVVSQVGSFDNQEMIKRLSVELDRRHQLVRAQDIQNLGARRVSHYRFQHNLYQSYLYQNLDPVVKAHFHEAVGTALEAIYDNQANEFSLTLARHFQEAGVTEKAIRYLLVTGENARRSSAHDEAILHITQGLDLLRKLPDRPERHQLELDLLVSLGVPLVLTRGHAASEVETIYSRALDLSIQVGDASQRFQIILGLRRFYLHRGELDAALAYNQQLLEQAESLDPQYVDRATMLLGEVYYRKGEFQQALASFTRCVADKDPKNFSSDASLFGNDVLSFSLVLQGLTKWQLGYPDQALVLSATGLARAQQLDHPFSLACALYFNAALHELRGELDLAHVKLDSLLSICKDRGFSLYSAWGTALLGRVLVKENDVEAGIEKIQRGLAAWQEMGAKLTLPEYWFYLGDAYRAAGRVGEGLEYINTAIKAAQTTGERTCEAELYRVKGELFSLTDNEESQTVACFMNAMSIAQNQEALSWKLRAGLGLAYLWQKQGRTDQARDGLQEIYSSFTEGFATADLRKANAFLK